MMMTWHQTIGRKIEAPMDIDQQLALIVSIELAGKAQPLLLSLHATASELLIFNHLSKQWSALPLQIYSQLLPIQVFGD